MQTPIPVQGIGAYMASEQARHFKPNVWNAVDRLTGTVAGFGGIVAAWTAAALLVSYVPPFTVSTQIAAALIGRSPLNGVMIGGIFTLAIILIASRMISVYAMEPVVWERYSIVEFKQALNLATPYLAEHIERERAQTPQAEFEVSVLRTPAGHQIVVYRMLDYLVGPSMPYGEDGRAEAIFDERGTQLFFDERYVPYDPAFAPEPA